MPSNEIMQCTLILDDCCVVLGSLFGGSQDKFWNLLYLSNWYMSFYPTCTYIMTCTRCQSNRSNSNNNIIILLLYIHWIKLYIVVYRFQKKDDINSSRWLFSNLPDLSLYFVLSCHLFVVSFTYHPSRLIVVLSYIHIVYITGCEYVLHYLHLPNNTIDPLVH